MNYWSNLSKFMVSLLKSLYGDAATRRTTGVISGCQGRWQLLRLYIYDDMYRGNSVRAGGTEPGPEGLITFGFNPVGVGPIPPNHQRAVEIEVSRRPATIQIETRYLWKGAEAVRRARKSRNPTEVSSSLLPASPQTDGSSPTRPLAAVEVEALDPPAGEDGSGSPRPHPPGGPRSVGRRAAPCLKRC